MEKRRVLREDFVEVARRHRAYLMPEHGRCHCTMLGGWRCDKSWWKGEALYGLICACVYVYIYDYICITVGNFTLLFHYVVQLYTGQIKSEWK